MAIDIQTEILIRRPRADVAAFMFDPRNERQWTTGVVASRPLTPGPLRPGSRVARVTRFLGREFSYTYEVTAGDDTSHVDIRVREPFPMDVRYELEDADGGTLVRIRARGEASGFFKMASAVMAPMVRRNITKDLEALKACLEPDG